MEGKRANQYRDITQQRKLKANQRQVNQAALALNLKMMPLLRPLLLQRQHLTTKFSLKYKKPSADAGFFIVYSMDLYLYVLLPVKLYY